MKRLTKAKSYANMLDLSKNVIHLFLSKQMDQFLSYLDDDFVWIGDYDALFTRGKGNFTETITGEAELPPVTISEEEYTVLSKASWMWVTYGRCLVTSEISGTVLSTKFHFTFVWKTSGDEPKLLEAMACHTMDSMQPPEEKVTQSAVFKETIHYQRAMARAVADEKQLRFNSSDEKGFIYLYPSEILYIKACDHTVILHTAERDFSVTSSLSDLLIDPFIQIQRSYLINPAYVRKFYQGRVLLVDGTVLPVGRKLYSELRRNFGK